ncbi:hypothetical protein DAPPUDRAFT_95443, partial [Daphnia pulex]
MDKANESIDNVPVVDDEQQALQQTTKAEDCSSPNYLTIESADVANANDAYSHALQLESSLNESANDSYVQVEGLLKLPQLESTRISVTDADLSKVQSESGDSQNPLNAGFVKPNFDHQSSSKLDPNEISVFMESDSDAGQQIIESEDNAQPTLGTDSNMEGLNESIKSASENQGLDASVVELNDSALSISENQELNQHVEAEDSILPVSEGDSSVEVLMNTSIALQLNQEPIEAVPEKSVLPTVNGVLKQNDLLKDNSVSDKEPNEEIVNEISSSIHQELLNVEKSTSVNGVEDPSENVKTNDSDEGHLNDETTNSDPEVEQLMKLPETVSQLTSKDGVKVYLVGTAHFSLESQEDVAKTILMTRPRVVVVELCVSRLNILRFDEKTILEEAKNLNMAADAASEARSNSQLNEPPTVVGVVGIGHIAGISRYFGKVSESDVRKVMSIPPQTMASRVFVVSFKLSMLSIACYGCYKVIPKVLPSRLN